MKFKDWHHVTGEGYDEKANQLSKYVKEIGLIEKITRKKSLEHSISPNHEPLPRDKTLQQIHEEALAQ
jgi:hypothetical protein